MSNLHLDRQLKDQSGKVAIKGLLLLFAVGVFIFLGIKFIPAYVEHRAVLEEVSSLARSSAVRSIKDDIINAQIKRIIIKHELPEESIRLTQNSADKVTLEVNYIDTIDFLVTKYDWEVKETVSNKGL